MKIVSVAVLTLDGKIAHDNRELTNWSTEEDKIFFRKKLDSFDLMILGHSTYKVTKKRLKNRNCLVLTSSVSETQKITKDHVYINPSSTNVLQYAKAHDYEHICILGGTITNNYFLSYIDEIYLTVEPIIFTYGFPLFTVALKDPLTFRCKSVKKLNSTGTLLLHYVRA